ncbi:DUF1223 domain-containing protein [Nioella nitratireducens]|uniref:DUF1223 domain-containing protein n=1 Tax=Nioella nitratireducens TaxID=1287720 RepID=UPI0008FD18B2|nr:DUF1223 domain-containing protein [Nioella nitratireducens]
MRYFIACIAVGLATLLPPVARADSPVVVELFTSQGCSACPPADALLAELATRPDVIALSLHVDYWDYIGWADTFASSQFTYRQQSYARAAGQRMVYTPQMIVGGVERVVGYEPMDVAEHIMELREVEYPVEVRLTRTRTGALRIAARASMAFDDPRMLVQLVRYHPEETVEIRRGENAGRTVEYSNVVTDWMQLDHWSGQSPFEMELDDDRSGPVVVLVQMAGPGLILGAARLQP